MTFYLAGEIIISFIILIVIFKRASFALVVQLVPSWLNIPGPLGLYMGTLLELPCVKKAYSKGNWLLSSRTLS